MPAPKPLWLYHFTHVSHLPQIVATGLLADAALQGTSRLTVEAGDPGVKARRRSRPVPVGPQGSVGDYVPFYFAPRSPMLFKITKGGVPTYSGAPHDLVYLCSTVETLGSHGSWLVVTDRNAAVAVARFSDQSGEWDDLVDWTLMGQDMWNNTPDDPERMERRMAECLVHRSVPWSAIMAVGVADQRRGEVVADVLRRAGASTRVVVRPRWYY